MWLNVLQYLTDSKAIDNWAALIACLAALIYTLCEDGKPVY